jgi:hypothetical protein
MSGFGSIRALFLAISFMYLDNETLRNPATAHTIIRYGKGCKRRKKAFW